MAAPDEREFVLFLRGQVRDEVILASFRNDLRALVNPDTRLPFTEDEIARATQHGTRFWSEADAEDLYAMAQQQRALFLADQVDPRRAATPFLEGVHVPLWLGTDGRRPASGASGVLLANGVPGTTYVGASTVPDPAATIGTGPNGVKYQVIASATVPAIGHVEVSVRAVDAGSQTNLGPDAVVTWGANAPLGSQPTATVQAVPGSPDAGLVGGVDAESNQQLGARVAERIRSRPASGNASHFLSWGRRASAAVERAFTYPCALHAGTVVVAPTQVRTVAGPTARLPTDGALSAVRNYLSPPASPVVPERAFVLVVAPRSQPVDMVIRLAMVAGAGGGWSDAVPWPAAPLPPNSDDIEQVQVSAVTSQTSFDVTTDIPLPANATSLTGTEVPALMVWDDGRSRFELLHPSSVSRSGSVVTVTLTAAPVKTLAVGDRISPYTDRMDAVGEAVEQYFDSLGPGELVRALDSRRTRAVRRPRPQQEFPQRVGQVITSVLADALGGTASDADLTRASRTEPDLPGSISDGPFMLTLGRLNIYPLTS